MSRVIKSVGRGWGISQRLCDGDGKVGEVRILVLRGAPLVLVAYKKTTMKTEKGRKAESENVPPKKVWNIMPRKSERPAWSGLMTKPEVLMTLLPSAKTSISPFFWSLSFKRTRMLTEVQVPGVKVHKPRPIEAPYAFLQSECGILHWFKFAGKSST